MRSATPGDGGNNTRAHQPSSGCVFSSQAARERGFKATEPGCWQKTFVDPRDHLGIQRFLPVRQGVVLVREWGMSWLVAPAPLRSPLVSAQILELQALARARLTRHTDQGKHFVNSGGLSQNTDQAATISRDHRIWLVVVASEVLQYRNRFPERPPHASGLLAFV